MGFSDFFERQDRALAAVEDRCLGAIQRHYSDPYYDSPYGDDYDEEQEDEEEDGDGEEDDEWELFSDL